MAATPDQHGRDTRIRVSRRLLRARARGRDDAIEEEAHTARRRGGVHVVWKRTRRARCASRNIMQRPRNYDERVAAIQGGPREAKAKAKAAPHARRTLLEHVADHLDTAAWILAAVVAVRPPPPPPTLSPALG